MLTMLGGNRSHKWDIYYRCPQISEVVHESISILVIGFAFLGRGTYTRLFLSLASPSLRLDKSTHAKLDSSFFCFFLFSCIW